MSTGTPATQKSIDSGQAVANPSSSTRSRSSAPSPSSSSSTSVASTSVPESRRAPSTFTRSPFIRVARVTSVKGVVWVNRTTIGPRSNSPESSGFTTRFKTVAIRSTSLSPGNVPRRDTRLACTPPAPSEKPETSSTSLAARVANVAPSSKMVSSASTATVCPRIVKVLIIPGTVSTGAFSIGPSSTSSNVTRVAVPSALPAAKSPSTRTTMPTRRSDSEATTPSISIVADERSHRTPFTKTLPNELTAPWLTPVPLMPPLSASPPPSEEQPVTNRTIVIKIAANGQSRARIKDRCPDGALKISSRFAR